MLTPQFLEFAPLEVTGLMLRLQDWTINRIGRGLSTIGEFTSSNAFLYTKLQQQDLFMRDFRQELARVTGLTRTEIDRLIDRAARANHISDRKVFQDRGIPFTPFNQNHTVQSFTRNITEVTQGVMTNITSSMGFAVDTPTGKQFQPIARFYQRELDFASTKVYTGVQTFDGALKESIRRMVDSGVRTVDYSTGHQDRIDVAARRAVMGSMRDLTNAQAEYNANLIDSNVFEISWHSGFRPSHAWGGLRFDTTGQLYPTEMQLYQQHTALDGEVGTLGDYNCYHEKYAVFPDAPTAYTKKQLEELNAREKVKREFNGRQFDQFEARQQQRHLERGMRRQQSLIAGLEGAGLTEDVKLAKTKMRIMRRLYRDFSDAMGLPKEFERINTGFAA